MDYSRYRPNHPAEPAPPTFWNRFRCRIHGHMWHLDWFDYPRNLSHYLCVRCSRILTVDMPLAMNPNVPQEIIQE